MILAGKLVRKFNEVKFFMMIWIILINKISTMLLKCINTYSFIEFKDVNNIN